MCRVSRHRGDGAVRRDVTTDADARRVGAARGGDAVICVLPTGSGEADIVIDRAMANRPRQACLIVPTVALGLDLDGACEFTGERDITFAYHGGLPDATKTELTQRFREGAQWLIITSPEAACTALARPLSRPRPSWTSSRSTRRTSSRNGATRSDPPSRRSRDCGGAS